MDWQNAIFAPGWVWSMLGMVLVVGSLAGLYRQLRLQSAQGAREQLESLDREWNSERFDRCKLEVLLTLRVSTDPAGGPSDPTGVPRAASFAIAGYWERIAALAQGGHLDAKLLHSFNGGACPVWWTALAPFVRKVRIQNADPTEYSKFEWLAGVMAELDRRAGASDFNEELLAIQLDERIATYQDRLRLEQVLSSGDIGAH
jgi:hypothetical protein